MTEGAGAADGTPRRMPAGRRRTIYAIAVLVLLTGILWLVFHHFMAATDEFGFSGPHPLEQWWRIAHAAVSFWAIWMFGVVWPGHILPGWRAGLRRISGGTLFGGLVWLTVSGFLLYYLTAAEWRSAVSLGHWIVGLLLTLPMLYHARHRPQKAPIENGDSSQSE